MGEKRAVVTLAIGDYYSAMAEVSHPTHKAYAERTGADFVSITETKTAQEAHYEKFRIRQLLNEYHRILYLDTDTIIREDCPNLFELVPPEKLGMFNEGEFADRTWHFSEAAKDFGVNIEKWNGDYFNTGVMILSRIHKPLFEKAEQENIYHHYEQSLLNLRILQKSTAMFELDYRFNRMPMMDALTGEHRLKSYIVHYAGILRNIIPTMRRDLEIWASGEYEKIKRRVLFGVGARLGDVICAEPVARYVVEKEYADSDVTIVSSHPEVFEHLSEKARVLDFADFDEDKTFPLLRMHAMVPQDHEIWKHADPAQMNTTDWMSMLCLKKRLPDAYRRPSLPVTEKGITEVFDAMMDTEIHPNDLVLVHPGKGWPTKTFPEKFWTDLILELSEGCSVGIIGSDHAVGESIEEGQHGVLDFAVPEGKGPIKDLRNLLSVRGLFALLSYGRALVSNDSAPIHAAGAFDIPIFAIPTIKHPDYLAPYGSKFGAYYKKLMYDDLDTRPSNIHGWSIKELPGPIEDYLPDPKNLAKEILASLPPKPCRPHPQHPTPPEDTHPSPA